MEKYLFCHPAQSANIPKANCKNKFEKMKALKMRENSFIFQHGFRLLIDGKFLAIINVL